MPSKDEEADFTKAYRDLVEAEKTAATLEAQLNSLEQKLDNFLAEHEKEEEGGWIDKKPDSSSSATAVSDKDSTEGAGGS
ncbi:hypothetical protein Q9L58_008167 [Maublancomyces gigas]|uniref:Uncharacterized protein n=1 Tax=Discina gigas TaxID=1032678 RepID=A0ABR3GAF3_9PEZI